MINKKDTTIIILAAGKGTRMNSSIPKVLHEINNKSLIMHVIDCAKKILPKKIITIVGYQKDLVVKKNNVSEVESVLQEHGEIFSTIGEITATPGIEYKGSLEI